jgi:hypothetical protein
MTFERFLPRGPVKAFHVKTAGFVKGKQLECPRI